MEEWYGVKCISTHFHYSSDYLKYGVKCISAHFAFTLLVYYQGNDNVFLSIYFISTRVNSPYENNICSGSPPSRLKNINTLIQFVGVVYDMDMYL
jgi:hypothetical protein